MEIELRRVFLLKEARQKIFGRATRPGKVVSYYSFFAREAETMILKRFYLERKPVDGRAENFL